MSDTPGATTPAGTDGAETERPLTILIGAQVGRATRDVWLEQTAIEVPKDKI